MFAEIKSQSTIRLIEVRETLDFIKSKTPKPPNKEPLSLLISKGLFFVHLYGAYEYTVKTTVLKSIELINIESPKLNDCKPLLMSLALNSELDSIASVGDKKWEKRHDLFSKVETNNGIKILSELFPTNGRNLKIRQLQSIWNTFSMAEPILPRPELGGRITELISNRNAIAHGTSSAASVGSLNTITELYKRHSEISEICSYIIHTFQEYIKIKAYLK
jgi:hypothetical protein